MKHLLFLTGFFSVFGFSQSIRIPYDLSKVRSFRDWQGEFLVVPGQPKVPKITARILVPYGQTVKKVEFVFDSTQVLFEKRRLERVSFPLATCLDKSSQSRLPSPIENSAWYPQKPWSEPSIIQKYGYQVLYVDLYPAQYQSELEVISWLPSGDLQIEFTDSRAFFLENLRSDEQDEREALLLADDISAQSTYPPVSAKGGLAEYLIIGPKEFLADQSEYSINGLMREKASRGITSKYLTLEDIGTQFAGSSTQEKIRAAVKKSYKEEGTRYLLLIGNGYSKTPTKILTVELSEGSLPSDLYFGCLDGDFKTRPYDLACEVAVGRAPASTVAELRAFVKKSLVLQSLKVGDPLVWRTINFGEKMDSSTYASSSLKMLAEGGIAGEGNPTVGYPSQALIFNFYETPQKTYSSSQFLQGMNLGPFYTLNHLGHCQNTYCLKLNLDAIPKIKTSLPFVGFTQGCFPGNMRQTNWASKMVLQSEGGAGAFIANSNYGWYEPGGGDGHSNRLHTMFYDTVFREGSRVLGKTLYRAKERLISQALNDSYMLWVLFETNLFGDPEINLKFP